MNKRGNNPTWNRFVPFWDETLKRLESWELRFREKREQLAALERAVQETPEDARRLWELADALAAARQYVDARACLSALIALHPTSPQVVNGDAQVLLADVLASFHEMAAALALYQSVQTTFPDHPRVRDQVGPDSVRRRIDALFLLMQRMGMKT
jgi:cytochrome c-type biogenesis protein CcmH/NrfG